MKEISIFDVIGPNMIGPSSSHTAGALRIASMARKIVNEPIEFVEFQLFGSFSRTYKGHGTDRALLAGILGFESDDKRIKDSYRYAKEKKLSFEFVPKEGVNEFHPNTVLLKIKAESGNMTSIRGESIGGGNIVIKNINGVDINLTGEYHAILVKQKDAPGVVAHITNCLAKFDINIAFMKLYRENRGAIAYTIVETDDPICKDVLKQIESETAIISAVNLPK